MLSYGNESFKSKLIAGNAKCGSNSVVTSTGDLLPQGCEKCQFLCPAVPFSFFFRYILRTFGIETC